MDYHQVDILRAASPAIQSRAGFCHSKPKLAKYLTEEENNPAPGLLERWDEDWMLRELLRTPLWLNVARLAFSDADASIPPTTSCGELRSVIGALCRLHVFTLDICRRSS